MAQFEVKIPALGEGIIEVTLTRWLVKTGAVVAIDEPLAEIATDKVDSVISSPGKGIIVKMIYHEGEVAKVGETVVIIETGEENTDYKEAFQIPASDNKTLISGHVPFNENKVAPVRQSVEKKISEDIPGLYSPLIRHLARQRGLTSDDLALIKGTGQGGKVTKEDLNQYLHLEQGRLYSGSAHTISYPEKKADSETPSEHPDEMPADVEKIPMDRIRKLIATHMVQSKKISPHVTSFAEADVTQLVTWRNQIKERFFKEVQIPLTYTPLFVETVAKVLKQFPKINVSVEGDTILLKKNIHIGIATALHEGNLIVPVIRNADHENLQGLSRAIFDLVSRARDNKLLPAEIKGSTFTITNIGQYKSLTGTPIINQPEAAILAIGAIVKKPWVVKTENGYGIAIRDVLMLSLTYDHRVIDGALGGSFLNQIVEQLENFNTRREI
jgi:2-oxoglutarate dehydrogenase E2 component (dihydrolipoamide succinyltransferase)